MMDDDAQGRELLDVYLTGLKNMHALEMAAIEMTARQSERLDHYPEMKSKLQQHHAKYLRSRLGV